VEAVRVSNGDAQFQLAVVLHMLVPQAGRTVSWRQQRVIGRLGCKGKADPATHEKKEKPDCFSHI
jgi:hypothetical protein